ncbi:MAG: hypothetical protein WB816_10250 [Methylocystis sp.]
MFVKHARAVVFVGILLALAGAAAPVEFKPYGRGTFAELRKQHVGRPLAVHFWSVTCPSCLAELSEWAKIAREKQALDIVFVNADQDNDRPRAQGRIEKAGLAGFTHYGFADDFVERLYFEADKSWRGELPFTALIGANGDLVTVTGTIDDPLIANWMAKAGK